MSDYPNYLSEPTITQWGDYRIEVRSGNHNPTNAISQYSAKYDVFQGDKLLRSGSVAGYHGTAGLAIENATRIAKMDARESLPGPFPDE